VTVARVRRHNPHVLLDLSTPYKETVDVIGHLSKAVHSCYDSALLTDAGRQLLRVACADYLAALTDPGVQILIVGHTDQPGSAKYNYHLSCNRAENVRRALKDLFGPPGDILQIDLDVKTNVQVLGLSELHATLANMFNWGPGRLGEHVKNATYRRVDLIIDAQLVATFREHPRHSTAGC